MTPVLSCNQAQSDCNLITENANKKLPTVQYSFLANFALQCKKCLYGHMPLAKAGTLFESYFAAAEQLLKWCWGAGMHKKDFASGLTIALVG